MSLVVAIVIVVVATTVGITVMLLVRRGAPDGSYFNDGDRAAGVFGVLATGFSVLLGLVVFLAFASYDEGARRGRDGGVDRRAAGRDRPVLPAVRGV